MASKIRERLESWPEHLQLRLSGFENPPDRLLLALLGALCGLITGAIILAWHALITLAQHGIFSSLGVDGFLSLPLIWRLVLPVGGALVLGLAYWALPRQSREGGIVHVLERMTYHQSVLPVRNAAVQFLGSIGAIASGQSVGREGVAAHLGAATGSFLARHAGLPNHRIHTLVGCGVAAGIAASFDSPLSGVVFAMEVVMMEYSTAGFAPIILAAVGAAALLHFTADAHSHLHVVFTHLGSLLELPYLILCGCVAGTASAGLTRLTAYFARWLRGRRVWIWPGMLAAGAVTAVCALAFPQVMGVGFDTINQSLIGRFSLGMAIGITLAKIVATSAAVAVSLPGGLIVPTLFIGSTLGEALGIIGGYLNPAHASNPGLYALLGMGAMMGAVFQAPLTGMLLVVELSGSTSTIFPAMLIVITAMLMAREVFGVEPEFNQLLRQRGMDYRNDPVAQFLRRVGVARAMDRRFVTVPAQLTAEESRQVLESRPQWLLIHDDPERALLLRAADLVHFIKEKEVDDEVAEDAIDLIRIPGQRLEAAPINLRATLQEAFDRIESGDTQALFVTRTSRRGRTRIFGVLTRSEIENTYHT